jgi:uridine monophosphate synthetase
MLIPVSRAIAQVDDPAKEARNLRDAINHEREVIANENHMMAIQPSLSRQQMQIADSLLIADCIHFGSFTLKSGLQSPIYIDLRRLVHYPALLSQLAEAYLEILKKLTFDHLAALPYAALPIATAISLRGNYSMLYPRKEVKKYGTKAQIEGVFTAGQRAVVIDDLITSGGSKFEGIEKLTTAGLIVQDVVVLIDRQAGGVNVLAERGYQLHAVLTMPELLNYYERSGKVSAKQASEVRKFMSK